MNSYATSRRLLIVGFWLLFGAFSGVQIQISMLSHHHSWPRVICYQALVWSVWIGFTFAIVKLSDRWPLIPPRLSHLLVHAPVALGFGLLHIAIWVAIELILVPYDFMNPTEFVPRFEKVARFQMPLELCLYGVVVVARYSERMAILSRERERRAAQLETSLAQARLHALELQTQPHFLFNTLNGIGALVRTNQNPEALSMIGGLSDLLRYALDRAGGPLVTLDEEAGTVRRYLDIQRIRFADRLAVDVDLEPGVGGAAVPPLLLQPLAENAVQHGISRRDAPGRITLGARKDGDRLRIELFNTGSLGPERPQGIGLATTRERLAQLYGDRASLTLSARDDGVLAAITLPWTVKP